MQSSARALVWPRHWVVGLALSGLSCTKSTALPLTAPPDEPPAAPVCNPVPDTALAWLDGDPCGQALVGGSEPQVIALDPGSATVTPVELPSECEAVRCDYELADTSVGLLLVATQRGPEGETPAWVGLGITLNDGYRFVSLWRNESMQTDYSPAGPAFALAPFDCGGRLGFFAQPRGAAAAEQPHPSLVAAEGVYAVQGDELVVEAAERDGCTPVVVELP